MLLSILEQFPDGGFEFLEIDRLGEVGVEAGLLRALHVLLHAESGERDGWYLAGLSHLLDESMPVPSGNPRSQSRRSNSS